MSRSAALAVTALALLACAPQVPAQAGQKSPTPASIPGVLAVETYADSLDRPWGIAFLPDGRLLVTERPGRMRIVARDGSVSAPLAGVPEVMASGQGGLLDVAVDPGFAQNRTIYFTFSEPGPNDGTASTAAARAELGEGRLENVRVIYSQVPKVRSGGHYGSRIAIARDGSLFITAGDRMNQRPLVQDLATGIGKIVRIRPDGSIPRDNPFVGRPATNEAIWSYGHRNLQGATIHPETGQLWTVEHGAKGGDELNHPEKGKNYGWPVITYGVEYSGLPIGEGITAKEGMEQPVYYWDPVIAPGGITFYTGDKYPGWKGSLFIGSMNPGALVRLELANGRVTKEERYLGELGERIRDVQQGPDGYLYVATDNPKGRVLRVVLKK
ncbi:MAG TPA: PQQ-dependent sugar dehydrogenase [Gemmatimonadales bacterium]|nr:PQQ-dependent sugar dehydrogenase [Gemmatimonadales bacterium]